MKKIIILGLLVLNLASLKVCGQQQISVSIDPADPAFRQKFSQLSFEGKFSLFAVKDAVNNYFMADFTQLPGRFEKCYFMTLVYSSDKIVNIDSDITQERVWFLANHKFSIDEVNETFELLKNKTLKVSAAMKEDEKSAWMKKNDKFNQSR